MSTCVFESLCCTLLACIQDSNNFSKQAYLSMFSHLWMSLGEILFAQGLRSLLGNDCSHQAAEIRKARPGSGLSRAGQQELGAGNEAVHCLQSLTPVKLNT